MRYNGNKLPNVDRQFVTDDVRAEARQARADAVSALCSSGREFSNQEVDALARYILNGTWTERG